MKLLMTTLLFVYSFSTTFSQTKSVESVTTKHDSVVKSYMKNFPDQTQMAIAVIRGGEVDYKGVINKINAVEPIDNHQYFFEIGSISKVFTSTLLARFVLDKKLTLKSEINDYLPYGLKDNIRISFQSLSNHTSGMARLPSNLDLMGADPLDPYKTYDREKLESYLKTELKLWNTPGTSSAYSNLGAGLLAHVLGEIENASYEALLQKYIFSKYRMEHSTADISKINGKLVKGLNANGEEVPNWDFGALPGAGGILSNVEELSKFVLAHFDAANKELALTQVSTFKASDKMELGLGWHLLKDEEGDVWSFHNGGTGGYTSAMALNSDKKEGIIILTNISAFNPKAREIDQLCFELLKGFK